MAILKCKMCGGDLEIAAGATVGTCTFCDTKQTLPKSGNEVLDNLFNRANALRLKCEFDKAEQIYEKILQEDETEAEAHWGIVLCKYGIEYVEDPKTYKRIPTCHRTSYDAVTADAEYKAAIQYADAEQKAIYEAEAKAIDEIQKNILSIVKDEKPFDVFICYKESDENGKRTMDSAIANDIYHQLTQEGLKVFYAAITLEDKLGREYEPYIFAALNSSKVMLVIGTKPQYFNAVWVKNEWGRFLKLMKSDRSKLLIPCYKDMDAYELPEEFSHLQAQDMSKIGFINDVVRGIKKVTVKDEPKPTVVQETVVKETVASSNNTAPLLERAFMFLEDGKWENADEYCEKVLDIEPKNARAYLGKLLADLHVKKQAQLNDYQTPFDLNDNYQKALRFGDDALKNELQGYTEHIKTRNENARLESAYNRAKQAMTAANTEQAYKAAAKQFDSIKQYKDAAKLAKQCYDRAETARKNAIYMYARDAMSRGYTNKYIAEYERAQKLFQSITGYTDADAQIEECKKKIRQLQEEAEERRKKQEQERILAQQAAEERRKKEEQERILAQQAAEKRMKQTAIISFSVIAILVLGFVIYYLITGLFIPNSKYNDAVALMEAGKYEEAIEIFEELDGYKDSVDLISECNYKKAVVLMEAGKYEEASAVFAKLHGYKDSNDKITACQTAIQDGKYNDAAALMEAGKYEEAIEIFEELDGYKDSEDLISEYYYKKAVALMEVGNSREAAISFGKAKNYTDAKAQSMALWEQIAQRDAISAGDWHTVGLKADGTVVAVGGNNDGRCDVSGWRDIVAISADIYHTVGLKADGTVVAVGGGEISDYGQCDVSGWTDIVAVSAGYSHTVGLKADGTVVAVGSNGVGQCDVSGWTDIVAISAGYHTVGLKADGTVVAVGHNGDGECDVTEWTDIVAISAGYDHTVGLKADGTVVAVGRSDYDQCDVSGWTDIVAISAGDDHTVGLKADGTVVAVGRNYDGECDVTEWTDIVAISAGSSHTVGLKADGTVVAVGQNNYGQCDVSGWTDIVAISAGYFHTVGLKADGTVVTVGENDYGQCDVSGWTDILLPKKP